MGASHAKERSDTPRLEKDGLQQEYAGGAAAAAGGGLTPTLPEEEPRLTEEDKRYLKETWQTLGSDPTTVGIITFSQLFEENPTMKDVFEGFRQIELEDLRASQELKQHAARVMGFVNKIISRLDSEEKYGPLMKELGVRHVSYGAKPQYVDLMGEQFINVIRPSLVAADQWSEGTETAWRKLFQVTGYSMKMGLQDRQGTASPRLRPNTPSPRPTAKQTPLADTSDVRSSSSDVTRTA